MDNEKLAKLRDDELESIKDLEYKINNNRKDSITLIAMRKED